MLLYAASKDAAYEISKQAAFDVVQLPYLYNYMKVEVRELLSYRWRKDPLHESTNENLNTYVTPQVTAHIPE